MKDIQAIFDSPPKVRSHLVLILETRRDSV